MINNFTIKNDINNSKKYTFIKEFIAKDLLRHKEIFPENLKIILYDYENLENKTGLFIHGADIIVDINLIEILRLYKKGHGFLHRSDIKHLPEFKSFKNYLLFVLYHELGHYNLKHCFNMDHYFINRNVCELEADKFSLEILEIKGG